MGNTARQDQRRDQLARSDTVHRRGPGQGKYRAAENPPSDLARVFRPVAHGRTAWARTWSDAPGALPTPAHQGKSVTQGVSPKCHPGCESMPSLAPPENSLTTPRSVRPARGRDRDTARADD